MEKQGCGGHVKRDSIKIATVKWSGGGVMIWTLGTLGPCYNSLIKVSIPMCILKR